MSEACLASFDPNKFLLRFSFRLSELQQQRVKRLQWLHPRIVSADVTEHGAWQRCVSVARHRVAGTANTTADCRRFAERGAEGSQLRRRMPINARRVGDNRS